MIRIDNVSKWYDQKVQALSGLTLHVERGALFGYIGPNGAGKSTTIKMLATLEYPDSGEVRIDGVDVVADPEAVRGMIGYMPELFGLYEQLSVFEYLELFARIYYIPLGNIDPIIELTGLGPKRSSLCGTLSKGNRQRVFLARILLHDPRLLLLDEPASGLDPLARIELRELLKELHRMGKTILISSHILADLEDICDTIGIIEQGKLLISGQLDALREQMRSDFDVVARTSARTDELFAWLGQRPDVTALVMERDAIHFRLHGDRPYINQVLQEALKQAPIYSFSANEGSLEEIFMRITKGTVS